MDLADTQFRLILEKLSFDGFILSTNINISSKSGEFNYKYLSPPKFCWVIFLFRE